MEYEKQAVKVDHEQKRGVYFLYLRGRLVYVGVSADIHVRLSQHRISGKQFDEVRYLPIADYYEAIVVEAKCIEHLRPPLNKSVPKLHHHERIHGPGAVYRKENYPGGWK